MYSIKATRIHVKNSASLSAPTPILRSTSPDVLHPVNDSATVDAYSSTNMQQQHARDSPIKSLMIDTGSAESSHEPTIREKALHSLNNEQRVRIPTVTLNRSSPENVVHSYPNRSNLDKIYSSSDMNHSPIQKDPSTPIVMSNSEVSETTPSSSPIIRASHAISSYESPSKSPPNRTKLVKITVVPGKRNISPPPLLKTSIIQSPTRARASPNSEPHTKKQIPLFYSPLLMRQLKQLEAEKSQRKDKTYFASYKGSTTSGRKSSPFSCLNPVDDCILPETPSSSEELWNKSSSSSSLLNQYNQDLFLDLGADSVLDPPSSADLMTHEKRWRYQSNLAGEHKQELHTLDLSHRIYTSPISLLYGVPPKAASMVTELKYNAINLDAQNLSFLLELVGKIFPKLSSLTIQISQSVFKDDSWDPVLHNRHARKDSRHTQQPSHYGTKTVDDLPIIPKQRLYILNRLPLLSMINDVPVTEDERKLIQHSQQPLPPSTDKVVGNQKDVKPVLTLKDRNEMNFIDEEGIERALSTASASPLARDISWNQTVNKTSEIRDFSTETYEDDSMVYPSESLLCLVGRSLSWSHSDLSDHLDLRRSHSADEIDFSTDNSLAPSKLGRRQSCDSSLSNVSDLVTKMRLDQTVAQSSETNEGMSTNNQDLDSRPPKRFSHHTIKPKSYLRALSSSSASTSNDDQTSESSSFGNNLPPSSMDKYFSSSDSRTDSPMPVQYRIKRIEDQLKLKGNNDSESDSNSGEYITCRVDLKDEAAIKRKNTRIKKDGSLPPTSPASIPRAPTHRLKKQKRQITISNMESLRKIKPIADQLFDDDEEDEDEDDEEQYLEENEFSSNREPFSSEMSSILNV